MCRVCDFKLLCYFVSPRPNPTDVGGVEDFFNANALIFDRTGPRSPKASFIWQVVIRIEPCQLPLTSEDQMYTSRTDKIRLHSMNRTDKIHRADHGGSIGATGNWER